MSGLVPLSRHAAAAALAALALAVPGAAAAHAAEPIMPLGQVQKGMRCTALSVLQGTEISSFDAEVVDVVAGDPAAEAPRILLRFSGPAIERTGVGPGFSGSPVSCPDGDGTMRVIGAISESVGEYGGTLALATPIEAVLGEPVEPPVARPGSPRASSVAAARGARPLRAPLSISGLSPRVARVLSRAAARRGHVLYAAPGRPRAAAFGPQQLRPGSAMAAGLASGDLTAGAVGTVAYVDGDRVWAFGHPLDGAGRRSLFLQDAYVFAVVNNPVQVESVSTYKLAAPGHDVGVLSGDGFSAVVGRLGRLPDRFPVKVVARDEDTGRQRVLDVQVADETAVGLPTGTSSLALAGGGAIAQAASAVLGSAPARQTGELCARIKIRERKAPLRFCNRYVTRGGGEDAGLGAAGGMVSDFAEAATAVDEFNFARLRIESVEANVKIRRGLRQAFLLRVTGPSVVRRGRTVRLRVRTQEVRGTPRWRTVRVRVPRGMPAGERLLTLDGVPADSAGGLEVDLGSLLFGEDEGAAADPGDEAGPRTIRRLARRISGISRYDGVRASFQPPGEEGGPDDSPGGAEGIARRGRRVLRDPDLRLSGRVRLRVEVR
jgi:hypothetical protein